MPDVVKNLLLLNIVMYVLTLAFNELFPMLALHNFQSLYFEPYQLVSHFFMHSKAMPAHILFNMFALVMFGSPLEKIWGPKRFLLFYFVSAGGAVILQLGINYWDYLKMFEGMSGDEIYQIKEYVQYMVDKNAYPENITVAEINLSMEYINYSGQTMVGASGAVMGLLVAFAYLFPNTELMLIFLPIPVKAKYFVPFYMLIELFLGVGNFQWDNIAHYAHLGGALFGFILVYIWQKDKGRMY